jgi:hypothetical protein
MVYNARNHLVSGLCPSYGILDFNIPDEGQVRNFAYFVHFVCSDVLFLELSAILEDHNNTVQIRQTSATEYLFFCRQCNTFTS